MPLSNLDLVYGPGQPAVGTILSVGSLGSPLTYRPVGNAGNLKWDQSATTADVSNQGSPFKQKIPTMIDPGSLTLDLHYIPGSVGADSSGNEGHGFTSGLGSLFTQRLVVPWKLAFPDGTTEYFLGFISKYPIDANLEKDLMINMTIDVTGEPTYA
jgi:hypothetical protein